MGIFDFLRSKQNDNLDVKLVEEANKYLEIVNLSDDVINGLTREDILKYINLVGISLQEIPEYCEEEVKKAFGLIVAAYKTEYFKVIQLADKKMRLNFLKEINDALFKALNNELRKIEKESEISNFRTAMWDIYKDYFEDWKFTEDKTKDLNTLGNILISMMNDDIERNNYLCHIFVLNFWKCVQECDSLEERLSLIEGTVLNYLEPCISFIERFLKFLLIKNNLEGILSELEVVKEDRVEYLKSLLTVLERLNCFPPKVREVNKGQKRVRKPKPKRSVRIRMRKEEQKND